jgi:hypothetical protein
MKSRVFTLISLIALVAALVAVPTASAQTPAQDVYNPNGEVLDVVEGGGGNKPDIDDDGGDEADEVCAAADGRDAAGDAVAYGSDADCAEAAEQSVSEGELPFTGFEAGLVGLAGVALLAAGFAMRRFTRGDTAA